MIIEKKQNDSNRLSLLPKRAGGESPDKDLQAKNFIELTLLAKSLSLKI